jgi:hypothetical protein
MCVLALWLTRRSGAAFCSATMTVDRQLCADPVTLHPLRVERRAWLGIREGGAMLLGP